MSDKKQCSTCMYWEERVRAHQKSGDCHRYPPQVTADEDGCTDQEFPFVKPDAWCGEWSDKDLEAKFKRSDFCQCPVPQRYANLVAGIIAICSTCDKPIFQ